MSPHFFYYSAPSIRQKASLWEPTILSISSNPEQRPPLHSIRPFRHLNQPDRALQGHLLGDTIRFTHPLSVGDP